jgi:hypothetical protein
VKIHIRRETKGDGSIAIEKGQERKKAPVNGALDLNSKSGARLLR